MQGVLIVSSDPAVCASLRAILQEGRTIHERRSAAEALAFAAARKVDVIFADNALQDGAALELVAELARLGYSHQIIPLMLSVEPQFTEPFRRFGVRCFLEKPFAAARVRELVEVVTAFNAAAASENTRPPADKRTPDGVASVAVASAAPASGAFQTEGGDRVDARELSRRFQRLLAHAHNREELIRYFAEALEEQLDTDNVIVLLPSETRPELRIAYGDVDAEVREQFVVSMSEPLLAAVIRIGAPVWLYDDPRLDGAVMATARAYAERLGVQVLCPVLVKSRLQALVALGRSHRYPPSTLNGVLRLFISYFSRALDHAARFESLTQAEHAYRTLVEYLPDALILTAPDGAVAAMNHAAGRMFGVEADRTIGERIEKLDSRIADIARTVLETGESKTTEISTRTGALVVTASATPWQTSGTAALLHVTFKTDRDAALSAIEATRATSFWRDMGNAIAHNLKNALVPIRTLADLLPERYTEEDFRESFLTVTRENVTRIDRWIDQLSVFGRLDGSPMRQTPFGLHTAIEQALEQVAAEYPGLQVDVSKEFKSNDKVLGNRELIQRAFYELIKNAFEAFEEQESPRLRLRTETFAAVVQATVVDNGPGIPEENIARCFDPFHSGRLRGLGLGLPLAKRIIELHSGKLDLVPAVEAGTCIEIVLPAAERPSQNGLH